MTSLLTASSFPVRQTNDRDYISYSAISTYQQCPLKYFFKYIEGLPEETVSSSLVLGGAIHSAVEHHFNELMVGNPAPDQDTLLSAFWESWGDRGEEAAIQFGRGEDVNTVAKMADRILRQFRKSDLVEPRGRIIGVEETLRGELISGVPDLLARIDLIVESDDALTITDLKTSRSRWNASKADDSGEQLLLYSELVQQLVPGKAVRLEFAVITKAATPVAERFSVTYDPKRIARTKKVVERVWQSIQSGNFFPAPSPIACGGCPFHEPCRGWRG
jgi:CRISPR/Cas system-associated exonuclease Cas4 (RecB family)